MRGWEQSAYEIQIARYEVKAEESYIVNSSDSTLVTWPSNPLVSRERVRVRVRSHGRVRGEHDGLYKDLGPTSWSEWSVVECGLLKREDWVARAITASATVQTDSKPLRPLRFRKVFYLSPSEAAGHMQKARLYITALGVYEAYINGARVGDHHMAPGWTSYNHRLNYQVFEIESLLSESSANVIAVEVAEGWYATRLGFHGGRRYIYGNEIGVIAQIEVDSGQGRTQVVAASDESWLCRPSAIISSEIYDGEVYDAREEFDGWNGEGGRIHVHSDGWAPARGLEWPQGELVAPNAPPVRITEEVPPSQIITTPSGRTIVDFGQNLVGRIFIRLLRLPANHCLTLRHAEVLENQELGVRPLRIAKCTDKVISAGVDIHNWNPKFTFHGFRYLQIDGWPSSSPSILDSITAQVMHSDLQRTGWFECSHPMVNKLHQNVVWSMRGNFLSLPTDCPQRDERLGWTGDINIFTPSASFLYNTAGILGDWLSDLSAEQMEDPQGIPPFVVPNVIDADLWPVFPQAIWDDATILVPWALYQAYGDIDILRRQYGSMKIWMDKGVRRGPDRLWDPDLFQLGDWLDPTAPPSEPGNARTDGTLVADAYLVHVTSIITQICEILDNPEDAKRHHDDHDHLLKTFQTKYMSPTGLLIGDTQTALSLAIMFGLHASAAQVENAAARLARSVRIAKFKVSTGFAGTPMITHALSATGYHQLAYRMLLEKQCPSWMYPITMGATTIWERWDSMLPDGSINPGEMTSFNHYALGSVVNWIHKNVCGISPLRPGWKQIKVAPLPGGTITWAQAKYETPYGQLSCSWSLGAEQDISLDLVVPPNTEAVVILPGTDEKLLVGSGPHQFSCKYDIRASWPPKALVPPMVKPEDTFV